MRFPSAQIHMLVVESLPIYLVVWSWFTILRTFLSGMLMGFSIGKELPSCIKGFATQSILLADFESGTHVVEGYSRVDCGADQIEDPIALNDGGFLQGVFFLTVAIAVVNVLYCEIKLSCAGIFDYRSFEYCVFSWSLEQSRPYKVLASLLGGPPIIFLVFVFATLFLPGWADPSAELVECIPSIGILLFAIKRVLVPDTPQQAWGLADLSGEVKAIIFNRGLVGMFTQSNKAFSLSLLDALWSAENADGVKLGHLLQDQSKSEELLRLCKTMESIETGNAVKAVEAEAAPLTGSIEGA